MLAAIGDVRRDGMDPFERVEDADRGAGAGIRRRLDLETAVLAPADTVDRKRRASDVARDALEAPLIMHLRRLVCRRFVTAGWLFGVFRFAPRHLRRSSATKRFDGLRSPRARLAP